ncbi:hypothetical protein, partial [Cohnella massiliensis]|uniref:hypothetical protein n=1 Tax=Cohnella massiliensis TaxID=1816691 RepID=UPI001BC8B434
LKKLLLVCLAQAQSLHSTCFQLRSMFSFQGAIALARRPSLSRLLKEPTAINDISFFKACQPLFLKLFFICFVRAARSVRSGEI